MSILDHWEKKACSFTRKTREKAVSFSEITRIRSLIAGEEKNYHSLCSQVGEKYAQLHKDDYAPEFEELMTLIRESLERTRNYREQINAIRKVRPCPSCGEEVPIDFAYCNFCGAKLPEVEPAPEPGTHRCGSCGAVIPDSMKFCNHCGAAQEAPKAEESPKEPSLLEEALLADEAEETAEAQDEKAEEIPETED